MKKAMIDASIWDRFADHDLLATTQQVYLYLRLNKSMAPHGLNEFGYGAIARGLVRPASDIRSDCAALVNAGLIVIDNGVVFVPDTPLDQSYHNWNVRWAHYRKALEGALRYRSETGGINRAVRAWLNHHRELILTMEKWWESFTMEYLQLPELAAEYALVSSGWPENRGSTVPTGPIDAATMPPIRSLGGPSSPHIIQDMPPGRSPDASLLNNDDPSEKSYAPSRHPIGTTNTPYMLSGGTQDKNEDKDSFSSGQSSDLSKGERGKFLEMPHSSSESDENESEYEAFLNGSIVPPNEDDIEDEFSAILASAKASQRAAEANMGHTSSTGTSLPYGSLNP